MVPPPISKIRTVFITGLPGDVKERELQNLLRWFPGFEASQINFKAEQPMGFALFSTAQHAMAAKDALQKDAYNENFGKILFIYFMSFLFILQNTKDNPPCNTLFIGNLGENVNEEEVRDLFSMYES
ncbi:hypothetical protein B296_00046865 [Ensete ventricosum]|uniref:RRM domain-containing protein n=1 Tax=Ensete ventricosum TaxID=4639 RepID=A0A426Z226_ENSVE|nr:hypothetical protein B296_00046865 [Ensete ventricosum]